MFLTRIIKLSVEEWSLKVRQMLLGWCKSFRWVPIVLEHSIPCHGLVLWISASLRMRHLITLKLCFRKTQNFNWQKNRFRNTTKLIDNVQSKIHAVRMIQRFFMTDEILQLLKVHCYPSLYYASSVWLTPSLNAVKIQSVLSIRKDSFYNWGWQLQKSS